VCNANGTVTIQWVYSTSTNKWNINTGVAVPINGNCLGAAAGTPIAYVTTGGFSPMTAYSRNWPAPTCQLLAFSPSQLLGSWTSASNYTIYSCPSGYTLSGTTCYPPMVTPPPTPATIASYSCPAGSVLSGTTCVPTTAATVTYTCGTGMTLSGTTCIPLPILVESFTDTCAPLQAATVNPAAKPATSVNGAYACPAGKTLNGSNCI
jgi:hypothetical protein